MHGFEDVSDRQLFLLLKETTKSYIKNFDFGFTIEPMDFVLPRMIEEALLKRGIHFL